jgi:hypothetical protein
MLRRRIARVGAVVMIGAAGVGGSLAATTPAFAGSNGQQVYFTNGPADGFATIVGPNQYGQTTYSPSVYLDGNGDGQLNNWWWEGTVDVYFWNSNGTFASERTCYPPQSQWWSNWFQC